MNLFSYCVALTGFFAGVVSTQAAWNKVAGLDSVRVLGASYLVYQQDVATDMVLVGRRDSIFTSLNFQSGASLGNGPVTAVAVANGSCFAGTDRGGLFFRNGCSNTWSGVRAAPDSAGIRAFAFFSGKLYAATTKGLVVFPLSSSGFPSDPVNSGLTGKVVKFVTASGSGLYAVSGDTVYRSTNDGATWAAQGPVRPGVKISALLIAQSRGDLFAATDSGIYRSANGGEAWVSANGNLSNTNVRALVDTGANLFAATDQGIFRTLDAGGTWTLADTGMSSGPVYVLVRSTGSLYAGKGDGVWRRSLAGLVSLLPDAVPVSAPKFALEQGRLVFTLPAASRVKVEAYPVSGKRVAILVDQDFSAGIHQRDVSGRELSPGLYILRFRTGSGISSTRAAIVP